MAFFDYNETISVLEAIGENVFIVDAELDIVWINQYATQLITKLNRYLPVDSKEDMIGKNIAMFHAEEEADPKKVLSEGPFPYKKQINLFNRYTANIVINPLYKNDKINGYVLTWKDVTSYEKKLTDIRDAMNESTILTIVNKKGKIVYVNEKFTELSKYSKDELIGQDYWVLNADYSDNFYNELFKCITDGEVWKGEVKQLDKEGAEFWVHSTVVPFKEEEQPYLYVAIQQDITARKRAEELLNKSEKLSVLGELAAGVAHEIRNPLTTIKGFTQLLPTKDMYKQIMLDEIEHINMIVNEFMMLAKPHDVSYVPVNINEIIHYVIHFLEAEAHLKGINFQFLHGSEPVHIKGDDNQLKQVFLNVFKNAIEAMPDGGNIFINIRSEEEKVIISIRDEGVGLTSDEVKKLGEPFYSLNKQGTGLGLMMTFKIIENHEGYYDVSSSKNKGTTFYITLPIYLSERKRDL
ncbi:PAS domain-containing protein [Salipaludibacillus agaradhaerens]|uniref:PAS domain-containing protein n=1 Tax=Salipaludibacillus agaradhaerens TaxID=76935 RepID=UPI0021519A4E|nr:PAS domain-containing protein [Salipaludibacillus agaradhaerens]MCR6105362.1 PAS domain-containing protein [Salipaludibacillus agaradhaerens]MCR6117403.1 PAS domain-containing protein [Salipaludibacillus agaradhaerens]UJW56594.1 PAS domain-containing protein [Bacillus sp. A116_S68]